MVKKIIDKLLSEPHEFCRLCVALLRGILIKTAYKLSNPNVEIGASFRAYCWPSISGPGHVVFGDKVSIDKSFLRRVGILTHTPQSIVKIGSGCYLGGVRISCVNSVPVGEEALLGSTTIIDSDIIPVHGMCIDDKWKERHAQSISVGSHFWAGTNSYVLTGAQLGNECVLGAGGVVMAKEYPDKALLIGNPARKIGVTRK